MIDQEFRVTGMTCDHCVQAVTKEVGQLAGVESVEVDLARGTVAVKSERTLERTEIEAALDEAGFDLTP